MRHNLKLGPQEVTVGSQRSLDPSIELDFPSETGIRVSEEDPDHFSYSVISAKQNVTGEATWWQRPIVQTSLLQIHLKKCHLFRSTHCALKYATVCWPKNCNCSFPMFGFIVKRLLSLANTTDTCEHAKRLFFIPYHYFLFILHNLFTLKGSKNVSQFRSTFPTKVGTKKLPCLYSFTNYNCHRRLRAFADALCEKLCMKSVWSPDFHPCNSLIGIPASLASTLLFLCAKYLQGDSTVSAFTPTGSLHVVQKTPLALEM